MLYEVITASWAERRAWVIRLDSPPERTRRSPLERAMQPSRLWAQARVISGRGASRASLRFGRSWLKVRAAAKNARAFLEIQKEFGSFDAYLWGFVHGVPVNPGFKALSEIPTRRITSYNVCYTKLLRVVPTKLMPRFFRSLETASERASRVGRNNFV